jgi:hypothetical protein
MTSLAAFVWSAVTAILIATYGRTYTLVGLETVEHLTDKNGEDGTDDARRMWVNRQVNTIKALRSGNDRKAKAATCSLGGQVLKVRVRRRMPRSRARPVR